MRSRVSAPATTPCQRARVTTRGGNRAAAAASAIARDRAWLVGVCLALAVGCSCNTSDAASASHPPPVSGSPAETPSATPTPTELPTRPRPTTASDEPEPPPASTVRSWLRRLREARALAHAGDASRAAPLFAQLVAERPASRRLRCEAGLVALHAGLVDDAEREIVRALDHWSASADESERNALAMCLYNRGLVAEARSDASAAATAYQRSIELRPNATVSAHLGAIDATTDDDDESVDPDDPTEAEVNALSDGVYTLEEWIHVETLVRGGATGFHETHREHHEGFDLVTISATTEASGEHEPETIEELALVVTAETVRELASVEWERWFSWYDEHAFLGDLDVVDGGPTLGHVVAIGKGRYGRGESPDSTDDESYSESSVVICAERLDWRCVEVATGRSSVSECTHGCRDAPDDVAPADDAIPEDELPEYYARGYHLSWSLEPDALRLTPDPSFVRTEPATLPRIGVLPLASLFEP